MPTNAVIAFGYHDQEAPRHWNIRKELQSQGREVIECHTTVKGLIGKYKDLAAKFKKHQTFADTVLVTFPGHFLMPLAWWLTRRPRKKLIFDAFISLYDTDVCDRRRFSKLNPYAWFLFCIDCVGCHLADQILIDTEAHKQFFAKRFKLNPDRIKVIYVGTRNDLFTPRTDSTNQRINESTNKRINVLFYGTYIPLQGIEHILKAAQILQRTQPNIHFIFIGRGQTREHMEKLARDLNLKNVTFENPVPHWELPKRIRAADLCLGIFGTSQKARRVIPHKVYDAVACNVPVVTADTPAIREKFEDDARVILCRPGDPEDLAQRIAEFVNGHISINRHIATQIVVAPISISVHVLTFNSGATLRATLESVKDCAEVLVIDGGSTDDTVAIAREFNAKVIPQRPESDQGEPLTDFAAARNAGLKAATQPWILSLDSDETASPELTAELKAIVEASTKPTAHYVPRRYTLPDGTRIEHASTYPNERLYFFHRDAVEQWIKSVHERPDLKQNVEKRHLKGPTLAPLGTIEDYKRKNLRYLAIEIEKPRGKGWGHWFIHRFLHTLRSRMIASVKIIWIWLIPRQGKRLPLNHELIRFWYAWKLICETCPLKTR